ncbi:sugar-binding transcriptional regulator [Saccharopolyspora erythraea]|uniref:Transcriptional regulator, DeoR family n=2 Tax=Saccharopolyspora erythraea TaxID=1836 RepID=A4FHA8_SACEN|nr:sugar-binding domain-containing protein [Saccharopolyspora erythraea]QRK87336.1 transcriptional regulator [Saccharopolyspora erythraea]CAM03433.1 transcriptional regulator, DeoR family [Saccharopolyspora erythraea NRRL 2338]
MSRNSSNPGLGETVTAAAIARRFYLQGHSKLEIAEEFGISRFKVARILSAAQERGLIRIEFDMPYPIDVPLSDEIRSVYGLRQVLVLNRARTREERPEQRRRIGALAAELLSEIVTPDDVIGLSWARSVNAMAESIRSLPSCPIVQLCGVQAGMDMRDRSVETVNRVAAATGGQAYPIYGPLVLPDRRTAQILREQPGIAETFARFRQLTKAVVSIGAWQEGESTVYDALSPAEREAIGRRGATAEVAARLFDAEGNALSTGLAHHVLAITQEELRRVPEVIALGYTEPKAAAIDAVLRSGIVTTLITDAEAAEALLERSTKRAAPTPPQD